MKKIDFNDLIANDLHASRRSGAVRFNLPPAVPPPTFDAMFDTIKAQLTVAGDKLNHLRRFL